MTRPRGLSVEDRNHAISDMVVALDHLPLCKRALSAQERRFVTALNNKPLRFWTMEEAVHLDGIEGKLRRAAKTRKTAKRTS